MPCTRVRPFAALIAVGAALVLLNPIGLAAHGDSTADYGFVAAVLAQGGLYLLGVAALRRAGARRNVLPVVLVVAALLRLTLLFEPPLHSSDIYRYVWDGRVQAAGINPYRFIPADPALESLRDGAIFPQINRADYAVTIYPPVAQMAFFVFTRVGGTLWAVKLGWLALEALAMLALARLLTRLGRPSAELLPYAWHPLPVWEIAGDGHVDAGMAAFLVLALWAWTARRHLATGALLAASVLIKPLTLTALPAFWRPWDWRLPTAFLATAVLVYLPYLRVRGEVVGFLPGYVGEEGMDTGSGFYLLGLIERLVGPLPAAASMIYLVAGTALLTPLALAAVRDRRSDAVATTAGHAQRLLFAGLFMLSPNYPWYFLVLVPLDCLQPWRPALLLTLLGFVLYAAPPIDGHPRTFIVQTILWGCVGAALAIDLCRHLRLTHFVRRGAEERPSR
jgi:alpha-1,6-mannosyltransferase